MNALVTDGLGKRYGDVWALRDVSVQIAPGETLGFIGPNGAGKTTFLNMVMGLLPATEGQAQVLGTDPFAFIPKTVGYVADGAAFPAHVSAARALRQVASVRGIADTTAIRESLKRVGLDPDSRKPTRAFSHGMLQRLNLAQALMESPEFLVLDEPANGLDAEAILALRELIGELNTQGTAVLLASHLLTEVERVCHRVLLVANGEIQKTLDLRALREQSRIEFADPQSLKLAGAHRLAIDIDQREQSVVFDTAEIPDLVSALCAQGAQITAAQPGSQIVEREFLRLIERSAAL